MSKGKILYSCDGSWQNLINLEKKSIAPLTQIIPSEICLKMRIEKKGRGGKSVTVIVDLPINEPHFKKLTKELKVFCGTGGSFKNNQIEIQGDVRDKVRAFLEKKNYQVKG